MGSTSSEDRFHPRSLSTLLVIGVLHEKNCGQWFFKRFAGRFAGSHPNSRPRIRILFTEKRVPFSDDQRWMGPVGIGRSMPLWHSTSPKGWWLASDHDFSYGRGSHVWTMAARRSDVSVESSDTNERTSNWDLTQGFSSDRDSFAGLIAMSALLDIYSDHLGQLRDKAAERGRLGRTVKEGKALDGYLVGDGLDVVSVASDLDDLTENLDIFRWGVPEFEEELRPGGPPREPMELVQQLRSRLRNQAARLARDTMNTTGNLRASAELRQAVANTRLQRSILLLSVAAAAIAVISLVISGSADPA